MAKIKLHQLHKIKLHPNRWLIWAIAYILFVAIAMAGYIRVSNINIDSEEGASSIFLPTHSYVSTSLQYGLRYPSDWSIEANSSASVTFLPNNSLDSGVTVLVTTPASEKSIWKSLKIASESVATLGGVSASKIRNDLGAGHSETVIIATHNQKLYIVRGSDNLVQKLLLTFHFLSVTK